MGLDAGEWETCCVYSLGSWHHVDPRMLNLVLSSVAAHFITPPGRLEHHYSVFLRKWKCCREFLEVVMKAAVLVGYWCSEKLL